MRWPVGVLVVLFLCPGIVWANRSGVLPVGEYLSQDYIANLKKTHSPMQAQLQTPYDIYAVVTNSVVPGAKYELNVGNFHEGSGPINITADGIYVPSDPMPYIDLTEAHYSIHSNSSFSISIKGRKPITMIYVANLDRLLASLTVAGHYTDQQGHKISFDLDCIATFPTHSFRYAINPDYGAPPQMDCLTLDGKTFAFKRSGKMLLLYATSGDYEEEVDSVPTWVLRKRRCA